MDHGRHSLLDQLSKNEQKRRGKNNRAFLLAHWDEIVEALGAGWNMRSVWNFLHSKSEFPGSYDTFVKLVRAEQANLQKVQRTAESPKQSASPITKQGATPGEFSYPTDIDEKSLF